jgi:hypothetical protein
MSPIGTKGDIPSRSLVITLLAAMRYAYRDQGGTMSKLLLILLALGFIAASALVPAFAQKQQKQSCEESCTKQCEMALSKSR